MCECFYRARARKISLKNVASTPTFSLSIGDVCEQVSCKPLARFRLLTARRMATNVRPCPAFILWQTGNHPSFRNEKMKSVVPKLTELRPFPNCQFTSQSYMPKCYSRNTTKCY